MNVTVNGKERQFEGEAEMPLLWFLRDELQLTGTKFGCGMGLCGACTVHIDGQAARSCVTPMSAVADKKITTIEGLAANGDHPCRRLGKHATSRSADTANPARSCRRRPCSNRSRSPPISTSTNRMQGNICRCGTYQRIRKAIKHAAGVKS